MILRLPRNCNITYAVVNDMKERGFTLLEMLLVLVIIASIMGMFIGYTLRKSEETRIDKMVMTTQQILSASLNFYNDHGSWTKCTDADECIFKTGGNIPLLMEGYVPDQDYTSLWPGGVDPTNDTYIQFSAPSNPRFRVCIPINAGSASRAIAETIASRLPLGTTTQTTNAAEPCDQNMVPVPCTDPALPCRVVTTVQVPGQNLNNARSINFGGVYHNGACVPVPDCPGGMKAQIFVSPVSVSGLSEGLNLSTSSGEVVPLSSFTAYVKPSPDPATGAVGPENCTDTSYAPCYQDNASTLLPPGNYWRVCLDIVTEKGQISGTKWVKESGSVAAITRCVPDNEPSGSEFDLFINK